MDRSSVITLVSYSRQQDENGVWRDNVPTTRDVFAQVDSVSRAEFFAGGETGLKPELRFTMLDAEYEHERTVIYNNVAYVVYRTYHARTDVIELYAERRAGVNNG